MNKIFITLMLLLCCSCVTGQKVAVWQIPDYNRIASHVRVVDKSPTFVTYEYKDISIDEVAPVAAVYCHDRGNKQASLYEITMRPDNSRRAVFVCKEMSDL